MAVNVNGIQSVGSLTGTDPSLSVVGTDTNRGLSINVLGTGGITLAAPVIVGKAVREGIANPTYSASITPDSSAGNWQRITATDGVAFAVNAPTNPPDSTHSQELYLEFYNNSGGAMGAVTLNAAFVLTGGAVTYPANTKKRNLLFRWNSTAWIEITRSAADY